MDFGLREWLIIIGLLVIAGILFDGWRRMGGRSRIRVKLERNLRDLPDAPEHDELLGPARIVSRADRAEPSLSEEFGPATDPDAAELQPRQPQQVGLDLDEPEEAPVSQPQARRGARKSRVEDEEPATASASVSSAASGAAAASEPAPVDEVLVIHVVSRSEEGFPGAALLQSIMESGLRFGDMDIFHRHESMTGYGDVLFSMANALKPGTFDPDALEHSHVRAVSFFMGLPGPRHPKQALDLMIAAARKVGQELAGDLKDENRSVLTAQTIEHYRQRIAEFERKRMSHRR